MIKEILESKTKRKGNRALCICDNCRVEFITKFAEARDGKHNFCCIDCFCKYQVGENNSQWKDGNTCYRKLLNLEKDFYTVVHHKDGNRSNNKLDNLEIMTRKEHNILHNKLRAAHRELQLV